MLDIFGKKKIKELEEKLEAQSRALTSNLLETKTLWAASRRVLKRYAPTNLKAANASRDWKDLDEIVSKLEKSVAPGISMDDVNEALKK